MTKLGRMTKWNWPRFIMLLVGLVIMPTILFFVATALVPRDKLVADIVAIASDATGAEFTPGDVSLKVVGGLGIRFSGGRIKGSGTELRRRAGLGEGITSYSLEYSQLDVSLALLPLLRQQVAVTSVHLAGSQLVVIGSDSLRLRDYDLRLNDLRWGLAGTGKIAGAAPGDQIPDDLSFGLKLRIAEVWQPGAFWHEVQLSGDWAARRLEIASFGGQLGEGALVGSGSLAYDTDPWGLLSWQATLTDVPAGPLLGPYFPDLRHKLVCALSGTVTGSMSLRDAAVRQQSLALVGELEAAEGVLYAASWLENVSRYLGNRQDLKTVAFSRLGHGFRVADNRYLVDSLEIDGHETDWQVGGWLGFSGDLEVAIGVRLPAGFTPELGTMSFLAETLRDDEGRINLGFKLSGQTAAPTFGLDFGALSGRR